MLPTDHPIYLIKDDFDLMTMGGQLLNEQGEFDDKQFEEMMIKELLRYSQRQLTFCMTETGDTDNKVDEEEGEETWKEEVVVTGEGEARRARRKEHGRVRGRGGAKEDDIVNRRSS